MAMTTEIQQLGGMLLIDSAGSVVSAAGVLRSTSAQSALIQKWKREGTARQVLALRAAGQELVVLCIAVEDGTLFVKISSRI